MDGIKEPQRTKVENELKRLYRYNGEIYNAVTFLCMKLLEGCRPEKKKMNSFAKIAARMDSIRRAAALPLTCMGHSWSESCVFFVLDILFLGLGDGIVAIWGGLSPLSASSEVSDKKQLYFG